MDSRLRGNDNEGKLVGVGFARTSAITLVHCLAEPQPIYPLNRDPADLEQRR
jgi:hypothetical protein